MLRLATAALAGILLLSGCSDDGPDAGDPMSTWTPTGTIEPSSPSPSATKLPEPVLPSAARAATRAGAAAFVEYYWLLVDYATATGDTRTLGRLAGPKCEGCRGGVASIDNVYEGGGHIESAPYEVRRIRLDELAPGANAPALIATVTVRNREQRVFLPGKPTKTSRVVTDNFVFALLHVNDGWRVDELQVEQ